MQQPAPVVLTGTSGFIGQHVKRRLLAEQLPSMVLTVDIRSLEKGAGVGLRATALDGTEHVLSTLRDYTLVHLAWCPPVRDQVASHALQVNLLAALLATHADSIGRVIALGSADEYGAVSGCLREEDAMNSKLSPYGWGKRAAQMLLETWCELHKKPGLWLRPFLVYGEGQHGNMAIPYAIRQALAREAAQFSAGTQRRDFIHVDDVARAICLAVDRPWTGFKIANLGTGKAIQLREVLEQIARIFNAVDLFQYGVRPMRPGEPEEQRASVEQAAKLLGFTAEITLDTGLHSMHKKIHHQHDIT